MKLSQNVHYRGNNLTRRTFRRYIPKMEQSAKKQEKLLKRPFQERRERIVKSTVQEEDDDDLEPARPCPADELLPEETRIRRLKLYGVALSGDWKAAECIYRVYKDDIGAELSRRGDTALHIAAAAERTDFVKELVTKMKEDDIKKKNIFGHTALLLAAASGNVKLAEEIMNTDKTIAMIPDHSGTLPIVTAASSGHEKMVKHLYEKTIHFLREEHRRQLFITCIETDLYDVATQLFTEFPFLATARAGNSDETALHVLSRKDLSFSDLDNQNQQGIFKRSFNLGPIPENNTLKALKLVELIWDKMVLLSDHELSQLIAKPRNLIFDAAKRGNDKFLSKLIRKYPDLIWKLDERENSIFHIAVKNRQEGVFKLVYEIGSSKDWILMFKDEKNNNILHLAASLAPQDRLNIVSGEALQFQRELIWFEEVQNVVPKRVREARNKEGLTPRELFLKEHQKLREKGEQWMKETANVCIVVATLTATVAFTAALTVPGGNDQDTGFPILIENVIFKVFAILDAISLVLSLVSMATFLNIFVSRYAAEDLLWRLPTKFYIGMLSLLSSLFTLVAVFSAIFFIFFKNSRLWLAIVAVVAPTPIYVLLWKNIWQVFYDVVHMNKNSDSLFQRRQDRLFLIEPEPNAQREESKKNSAESMV